jgi:hypothetical protein
MEVKAPGRNSGSRPRGSGSWQKSKGRVYSVAAFTRLSDLILSTFDQIAYSNAVASLLL